MSKENVELHRRAIEAFNARDLGTFVGLADPSIEAHSAFAEVGGAEYHGHDGMRTFSRDIDDIWGDDLRLEPETYFDLGDHTLLFYVARGRGSQSGAEVVGPYAQVAKWRGGLCVYWKAYSSREDALRDLGVSEDALEPITP
jgi:hypothetical protein